MAGPICTIFPKQALDYMVIAEIDIYIESIGTSIVKASTKEWSFWVLPDRLSLAKAPRDSCQFSIFIEDYAGLQSELSADELRQIENKLGYQPTYEIVVGAGCNRDIDHIILAKVALQLLNRFGGYVNFNGRLTLPDKNLMTIEGKLFSIFYPVENNNHYYNIGDATFLNNWIIHPKFRMIK